MRLVPSEVEDFQLRERLTVWSDEELAEKQGLVRRARDIQSLIKDLSYNVRYTGIIEDFERKEFIYHVYNFTKGKERWQNFMRLTPYGDFDFYNLRVPPG